MRWGARRSGASVAPSQDRAAAGISAAAIRRRAGVSAKRSKRCVSSISAASPRAATSARMPATTVSTSAAASRRAPRKPAKAAAKPGAALSSLSGKGGLAETPEPSADLLGPRLECCAVDDQPRGDLGDALDLDEAIGAQRRAGLNQIDDMAAEAEAGGQLHRAVELDAFRLDATRGEMAPRDLGIFGRDPDMAPP